MYIKLYAIQQGAYDINHSPVQDCIEVNQVSADHSYAKNKKAI